MSVYVDDMRAKFGRMVMCHMMADPLDELHAMADRIGVARKWLQDPHSPSGVHCDISLAKRALAVKAGAVEITQRQMAAYQWFRRHRGALMEPVAALAVMEERGWKP